MIRLAIGTLRHHLFAYAGTLFAAVLAVALMAGSGLLLFSVLTAQPPADRFANATHVISGARDITLTTTTEKQKKDKVKVKTKVKSERLTGAGTLPEDLAEQIRAIPGVRKVVEDRAFPVVLMTKDGKPVRGADNAPVIGHGWDSAGLTEYQMEGPKEGELVLDADLAARAGVGPQQTVLMRTKAGTVELTVAGITPVVFKGQGAIYLNDKHAESLSAPTAIAIIAPAGLAVDGYELLTGTEKVTADLPGALPDYIAPISIFGFVIGITVFAAVFVLTGTVALAVRQRMRELALLRTTGATPKQLRRMLSAEGAVLATIAAVAGLPLGIMVAQRIAARFRDLGVVPPQFEVALNPVVLIAAAVAGIAVTVLAARIAGRRAARIAPSQALAETVTAPKGGFLPRIAAAVFTTAIAVGVLAFVPFGGPMGMGMSFVVSALLMCTVAALGPVLVNVLVRLVSPLARLGGVTGWLAAAVSKVESRRVASVAVPLALMFALNATMLLNSELSGQLAAAEQTARAKGSVQVALPGGLPLKDASALMNQSGITGATALIPTRVVVSDGAKPEDFAAQGIVVSGQEQTLDLGVLNGAPLTSKTFAASQFAADTYGWKAGDIVTVWLPDGHEEQLRLESIYTRARGFGDLVLPGELAAAHDPRGLVTTLSMRGTVPAGLATPSIVDGGRDDKQQGAWEMMVVISLGFTAIAVVNTFAIAASSRRREFAGLRLAGATAGQLHRMAIGESVLAVGSGLVLGATVTGIVTGVFSMAQQGSLTLVADAGVYLAMLASVGLLGLAAGWLPTRLLVRRRSLPFATTNGM